jgi:hypothetical protein
MMNEGAPDSSDSLVLSGTEVVPYQDFPVAPIEEGGDVVPYMPQGGDIVPVNALSPDGVEVLPQNPELINVESANEKIYEQYGNIDDPDRVAERFAQDMEARRRKRQEDAYMRLLARMVSCQMSGGSFDDLFYSRYQPDFLSSLDIAVRNSQMPTFEEIRMQYPGVSFEDDERTEEVVEEPLPQVAADTGQEKVFAEAPALEEEFQPVEDISATEPAVFQQSEVPALTYQPSDTLEIPLSIGSEADAVPAMQIERLA